MQEKSKLTAYVLWLLIGAFGAHRFYLGRIKTGAAMAGILIFAIVCSGVNGYIMVTAIREEDGFERLVEPFSVYMILSFATGIAFLVWFVWFLLDLWFIHVMMKRDRQRQGAMSSRQAEDVFG